MIFDLPVEARRLRSRSAHLSRTKVDPAIPWLAKVNHHRAEDGGQYHQDSHFNDSRFLGMRILVYDGPAGKHKQSNIADNCHEFQNDALPDD